MHSATAASYSNARLCVATIDTTQDWIRIAFENVGVYSLFVDSLGWVYAGTDSGLYRSTNQGANWSLVSFPKRRIGAFFADTKGRFFAVTDSLGGIEGSGLLLRSTDGGVTWNKSYFHQGDHLELMAITGLPSDNLFLGISRGQAGLGGVYYSSDVGQTWTTKLWGGIFTSSTTALVRTSRGFVLAAVSGYPPELCQLNSKGEKLLLGNLLVFSIALDSVGTVYAGGLGTIYRSTDNGKSWSSFKKGLPSDSIRTLVYSPAGALFALGLDSLYLSVDGANSWMPFMKGLPATRMSTMQLDNEGYLFLATARSGVFRTKKPVQEIDTIAARIHAPPNDFVLFQNYPNPFNPSTTIAYEIPEPVHIRLVVYNALGQQIATLVAQQQNAGAFKVVWNASTLSSGIYFYRLQAGEFVETKKMVVVK
jgi:photosystem II stability/assembly factor-like uncharacterized protein